MEGLYNLRGAIGPPYLTTRHKRNHNNKLHLTHGHHHSQIDLVVAAGTAIGSDGGGYANKRLVLTSYIYISIYKLVSVLQIHTLLKLVLLFTSDKPHSLSEMPNKWIKVRGIQIRVVYNRDETGVPQTPQPTIVLAIFLTPRSLWSI